MYKLILFIADVALNEYPLDKDQISIGRAADNDIVLDDPVVSSHHAVIDVVRPEIGDAAVTLVDLNSKNGTRINGKDTRRAALRPDDVIQIGRSTLRIISA